MSVMRWLGQAIGIRGGLTVRGEVLADGEDIRTRSTDSGGGDVLCRSVRLSEAGFFYFTDSGAPFALIGPESSPASYVVITRGSHPLGNNQDDFNLDLSTGQIYIPKIKVVTAITINGGTIAGSALPAATEGRSRCSGSWNIVGWVLLTNIAGAFRVEVKKVAVGSYTGATPSTSMTGTSASTGGIPKIVSGVEAASSDVSLWPDTTLTDGDIISSLVNTNTPGASWYSLALLGTKAMNV